MYASRSRVLGSLRSMHASLGRHGLLAMLPHTRIQRPPLDLTRTIFLFYCMPTNELLSLGQLLPLVLSLVLNSLFTTLLPFRIASVTVARSTRSMFYAFHPSQTPRTTTRTTVLPGLPLSRP